MPTAARFLIAIALTTTVTGCFGGSGKTKAGGGTPHTLTLRMATPDGDDPDAAYFAAQVTARTAGRVRVVVDSERYPSSDPDNEVRLVRDLRAGKVSLAYVPARAWERDGITSFRALQAPFLISDYDVLREVADGAIGRSMLEALEPAGLVGLGLVPKQLRRPVGRRPLTSLRAFRGARIRVVTSASSVRALRALRALPRTDLDAGQVLTGLTAGDLDGAESDVHAIKDNGYVSVAPYLPSNLPLFAKAEVIVIARSALGRLTRADQSAVRKAAALTVAHADPAAQERTELAPLCDQGLRLVEVGRRDLASLRRSGESAYAALSRDPATEHAIAAIERLRDSRADSSSSRLACPKAAAEPARKTPAFPEGRYSTRLTKADFEAEGATQDPGFPVPFVNTLRNGHWQTNEKPPFGGHYLVRGDKLTFVIDYPSDAAGQRETLKWSYYRGKLTFKVVDVAGSGSRVIYTAHPWRRLGK